MKRFINPTLPLIWKYTGHETDKDTLKLKEK